MFFIIVKEIALLGIGLALLWGGAELLVKYASRLARSFGVSPIIIGLTVISVGTSIPELVVSVVAAAKNQVGISIGNIVGSNIANLGLILGVGAVIFPLTIRTTWVKREVPFMIIVTLSFLGMGYFDHTINRLDGIILLILLSFFLIYAARYTFQEMTEFRKIAREQANGVSPPTITYQRVRSFFLAILGIAILLLGSDWAVRSATRLSEILGVTNTVIGLTLIAFGTSLPELATTVVSALRKEADLALGNIIGSNIFNLSLIGGITALIRPIPLLEEAKLLEIEFPLLLFLTLLVWPLMYYRHNVNRFEGALLLSVYVIFLMLTAGLRI